MKNILQELHQRFLITDDEKQHWYEYIPKKLYEIHMNSDLYLTGEAKHYVIDYIKHLGRVNHCFPFDAERCYVEKIKEEDYDKYFKYY